MIAQQALKAAVPHPEKSTFLFKMVSLRRIYGSYLGKEGRTSICFLLPFMHA